jgi:hypothetical protein
MAWGDRDRHGVRGKGQAVGGAKAGRGWGKGR